MMARELAPFYGDLRVRYVAECNGVAMSIPRDESPQEISSSISSYQESSPHAEALRQRNIIVPPLYFGMIAPKIYRRLVTNKTYP